MKLATTTITTLLFSFALAQTNQANTTEPLVCTPTECLQGHNSLMAGIVVTSPYNTTTEQITLLPGTYTPSAFTNSLLSDTSFANSTTSRFTPFSKQSTVSSSIGFASSGSLTSSSTTSSSFFSVSLSPGITTYSSPYYEGTPFYSPPSSSSSSTNSSFSLSLPQNSTSLSSLLLTSSSSNPLHAVISIGDKGGGGIQKLIVWDSIPDIGALGIPPSSSSSKAELLELVNDGCNSQGCSQTGGFCSSENSTSTCVCKLGWTGNSCSECLPGRFGKQCEICQTNGCKKCDDGLTGSGICLDEINSEKVILPSSCNCINGICQGNSTSSVCDCNAGWTRASNGTQCAACSTGYYLSSSGDCLACDSSCAECSSPSGTCQTCQLGLQPLSSSSTACTTATNALSNGTFITCPDRTFFDSSKNDCQACNSMCESCYKEGSDGCLECRSPNVLLEGICVAVDSKTGVCDGRSSKLTNGAAAGWVYDNQKKICDALPSKCSKGGIGSFSSSSTRNQLTCSACIPGSYLVNGDCIDECPIGTTVSKDGTSCEACDSSCSTCAPSLPSYCTSCSTSHLLLNGTCISSSSCPNGYFSSTSPSPLYSSSLSNSTTTTSCLACHPDCETCSPTDPTVCLTCPPDRPVLNSNNGKCLDTCERNEYFDTGKQKCSACSSDCETCYGGGKNQCLSCSGDDLVVKGGKCVDTYDCTVIAGFGVCLKELVTVEARSQTVEGKGEDGKKKLPWWLILVIVLIIVVVIVGGVWWFRKREQKRRREHTAKFARGLGDKEVDKKLAALPYSVAYPPLPRSDSSSPPTPLNLSRAPPAADLPIPVQEVPLTPRFVLENPSSPISPSPSSSFGSASHRPAHRQQASINGAVPNRWSVSSYGSKTSKIQAPPPLKPDETGGSFYSQRTFTTAAGNTLVVNSKNPFFRKAS
ncbi:hypothetical protein JCM3765_002837 [Sporobolomyces pararoseus]